MVWTHLKNISQIWSFPQIGVNIKNIWNHHLEKPVHDLLARWISYSPSNNVAFGHRLQPWALYWWRLHPWRIRWKHTPNGTRGLRSKCPCQTIWSTNNAGKIMENPSKKLYHWCSKSIKLPKKNCVLTPFTCVVIKTHQWHSKINPGLLIGILVVDCYIPI